MNKTKKDVLILGLALFAMFFGSGNLIFPPFLGLISGKSWIVSGAGFFLTAIGMPLLGIIAAAKAGGTIYDVGNKVGSTFSKIFATIIILAIGPLLAIPRTGATTFEMGVKPLLSNSNSMMVSIIVSIVFFGLTLYFVIKPSEIVDKVGKILTPILLIMIFTIIIKGVLFPLGSAETIMKENPLARGFTEGYQTMDALASIVFAGIMVTALNAKGYKNIHDQVHLTIKAGIIAACGIGMVYGGLMYLGACSNSVYPLNMDKSILLINITHDLLGGFGKIALGIVVSLACLTTSIGLTSTVGSFFNKLTHNKLSYECIVIATCIFSAVFANVGVETIVKVSVPLLVMLYPVAIVLIVMNAFGEFFKRPAYIGAVIGALTISIYEGLSALNVNVAFLKNMISQIPLANFGFAWVLPSLLGGCIAMLLFGRKSKSAVQ